MVSAHPNGPERAVYLLAQWLLAQRRGFFQAVLGREAGQGGKGVVL